MYDADVIEHTVGAGTFPATRFFKENLMNKLILSFEFFLI
jgi:hypothetical protein